MEKLNEYLQALLSTCSEELHLEPEKNPYLVSAAGAKDVANVPLLGTQISMMVFPLIPSDTKAALPHNSEVEFVHTNEVGNFSFLVQKSPAGFNVTVRPMLSDAGQSFGRPAPLPVQAPAMKMPAEAPFLTVDPEPVPAPAPAAAPQQFVLESSSAGIEYNAEIPTATAISNSRPNA